MTEKVYKCYTFTTANKQYFFYIIDGSPFLYANELGVKHPLNNIDNLDRVANVHLYSITPEKLCIIAEKVKRIYAIRDKYYDFKIEEN